jgi:hypothetical protein
MTTDTITSGNRFLPLVRPSLWANRWVAVQESSASFIILGPGRREPGGQIPRTPIIRLRDNQIPSGTAYSVKTPISIKKGAIGSLFINGSRRIIWYPSITSNRGYSAFSYPSLSR